MDNSTCVNQTSCRWEPVAGICGNHSIAADCSKAASEIHGCVADWNCDWYGDKCKDYTCYHRYERDCDDKVGCVWFNSSCLRSNQATCSDFGTIECLIAPKCGIDTRNPTNQCVTCNTLNESSCINMELCSWTTSGCIKQPHCTFFTTTSCAGLPECYNTTELCYNDFDLSCSDSRRCGMTSKVGCNTSTCTNIPIDIDNCTTLSAEECSYFINCSYSNRRQQCVPSDRCSQESLCDSVSNCAQLSEGTCVKLSDSSDLCKVHTQSSACVVDDRCTWYNNSCNLMVGCITNNKQLCESKQICKWNNRCQRTGLACDTINFNTACDGGLCDGVNEVYLSSVVVSTGQWIHGSFPPEFEPPAYTTNTQTVVTLQQKGIACLGSDCSLCQAGYIMTDTAIIDCQLTGGEATVKSTSGGVPRFCLPSYLDETAVPTSVPTVVPTAEPTNSPTAEPTAVPTTPVPTSVPTTVPLPVTGIPTAIPTTSPTVVPVKSLLTENPTSAPTAIPTEVPLTPDQEVYEEQKQTASVATSIAAISGALPAAGAVIAATIPCNIHDGGKLPFPLHPTGMVISGSISAGAVIGNSLIVGVFCLIMRMVLFLFTSGLIPESVVPSEFFDGFLDTQGMLRFPSAPLFVYQGLYQGTFLAAMLLMHSPPDDNPGFWIFIGVVAVLACVGVPIAVFYETRKGVPMDAIYYEDYADHSKFKTYWIGTGEWVSVERNTHWINRYASVARVYKEKFVFFSVVHFATSGLIAVVQSVSATGKTCSAIKFLTAVVFLSVCIVCLVFTPYARMYDNHIIAMIFFIQTISLVLTAIYFLTYTEGLLDTAGILNYVVISLLLLKVVLSFVIEIYIFVIKRRVRLQSNHWIKKMAILDPIQPTQLRFGSLPEDEPPMFAQKFSFSKLSPHGSDSTNSLLMMKHSTPGENISELPKCVRSTKTNKNDTSHLFL